MPTFFLKTRGCLTGPDGPTSREALRSPRGEQIIIIRRAVRLGLGLPPSSPGRDCGSPIDGRALGSILVLIGGGAHMRGMCRMAVSSRCGHP